MTARSLEYYPHLRLFDRIIAACAWAIAIALFVTVGWHALRPQDPEGAVSMFTRPHPWLMVVQVAALGMVVASVASLLVGRKLAEAGAFAACLGLAVANLRAGTLGSLLLEAADRGSPTATGLAASLLFEGLVWTVVVAAIMVVSAVVLRWCFGDASTNEFSSVSAMAGSEMPVVTRVLGESGSDLPRTSLVTAGGHLAVTAGVAFVLVGLLSAGARAGLIQHGQVYFAITAAFLVGGYVAQSKFPTRTVLWTWLAVPLVTAGAYVWAILADPSRATAVPQIPHTVYLRALPLEYVTLGTMGSIVAFWWTRGSHATK